MGNQVGHAYGLTALIPVKQGEENLVAYDKIIRDQIHGWSVDKQSPLASVPNTYLSRVYLLNDVFYQGAPAIEEHLNNKYLVFSSNFYGDLDAYLTGMWEALSETLSTLLKYCVDFDSVNSATDFVKYMKRCQVKNNLFFNGSNDKPLAEQLKALYVKQAFIYFAYHSQKFRSEGVSGQEKLQQAFRRFIQFVNIDDMAGPTWPAGAAAEPRFDDGSNAGLALEKKIAELVNGIHGENQ